MDVKVAAKRAVRVIVFLLILGALVLVIQSRAFKIDDVRSYQTFKGFYSEKKDSLDAVYIGQSNVYPFWSAPLCWEDYGYAVYPLAIGAMPARSMKFIVEEASKTQPDALYIINLNSFLDVDINVSHVHNVSDYMKLSKTKLDMINDLLPYIEDEEYSKLEFLFPIVRFHPGWNALDSNAFDYQVNGIKGGSSYTNFLKTSQDVSGKYSKTENRVNLLPEQQAVLDGFIEYVEDKGKKVLFVTVPIAMQDESLVAELNYAEDYVSAKGFDVLNMKGLVDEMGLDLSRDYYNELHLNIHGSIKFTDYLGRYLGEKYGFQDKRGDSAYQSWDEAVEKYHKEVDPYALDIEFNTERRDYSIARPELKNLVATGQSFYLGWEDTENAPGKVDGYLVYRRHTGNDRDGTEDKESPWEMIRDVDVETKSITDEDLELFGKYAYAVVPYKLIGAGQRVYGDFSYTGIEGITRINPPEIEGLDIGEDGNTLTWKPIEGVDGYAVVRRIDGQRFVNIAEVSSDTLSYTDSLYQDGVSYTYSVSGYIDFGSEEGDRKYGYYDQNGPRFEGGGEG